MTDCIVVEEFLSTPSARRATRSASPSMSALSDFYPRPPRGGRPTTGLSDWQSSTNFYPRPPRGGRQANSTTKAIAKAFLSTPSARRATYRSTTESGRTPISIHALREEGDRKQQKQRRLKSISIHALREEGDRQEKAIASLIENFYPRPPRGGRHAKLAYPFASGHISIHALREEGDSKNRDKISIFL